MAGFTTPEMRYDGPGFEPDAYQAADLFLTKRIAAAVEAKYPGHPWLIEVSHKQGAAFISIPLFMGHYKYVMHLSRLKSDPSCKIACEFAGQILERYRIRRGNFSLDDFLIARDRIPRRLLAGRGMVPA